MRILNRYEIKRLEYSGYNMFRPVYYGMGDLWALCSMAIKSRPTILYTWRRNDGKDIKERILEILNLFDWDHGDDMIVTSSNPDFIGRISTPNLNDLQGKNNLYWLKTNKFSVETHEGPFVSTKIKWKNPKNNRYCYKLTTTTKHHPERLLNKDDREFILNKLKATGKELVEIQNEWSLERVVEELANCERFYTINSGLSHVCLSVGCPLYVKYHEGVESFYPGKKYTLYKKDELQLK